jgi:hypothetical protein
LHPLSFLVLGGIAAGSFVQQIDAVGQEVLRCCMVAMLYALCCSVNGAAVGLHFRSWVCRGVSAAIFGIISTGFQVHHHWALDIIVHILRAWPINSRRPAIANLLQAIASTPNLYWNSSLDPMNGGDTSIVLELK